MADQRLRNYAPSSSARPSSSPVINLSRWQPPTAPNAAAGTSRRGVRPGWSPPRSATEKDQLIEKLVHDNEVLMKEVADLDSQLRRTVEDREALRAENDELLSVQRERESTNEISERLMRSMEAQVTMVRGEREEQAKQHAADKEFLNGIFGELEAQLQLARTEREELQTRAERERRGAAKRVKELEEGLAAAVAAKDRVRDACDAEKAAMKREFDQRVAGLRLEKEQSKLDKGLLRRLEKELSELKALSSSVYSSTVGSLPIAGLAGAQPGGLAGHGAHMSSHSPHAGASPASASGVAADRFGEGGRYGEGGGRFRDSSAHSPTEPPYDLAARQAYASARG